MAIPKPRTEHEEPSAASLAAIPELGPNAKVLRRGPRGKRLTLQALRLAAGKTQAEVARAAGMKQSEVSRLEQREDENVLLSTLLRYGRAIGAEIEVVAVYPKTGHRIRVDVSGR